MRSAKIVYLILLVLLVSGCGGGGGSSTPPPPAPAVTGLTVTPANPALAVGEHRQLTATGTFADSTSRDLTASVTWSSGKPDVATVGNDGAGKGLISGVAPGTAIITATSGTVSATTTVTVTSAGSTVNLMPVTVNGGLCASNSFPNKACVSVTVCTPGTNSCQTINDILLDTGSFGLRVFKSVLTVQLQQVSTPAGAIAQCTQFADGSSVWGPVQSADVVLGGEPAVRVPVQVIDASFGTLPVACQNAAATPAAAGFNGILGVGVFAFDCGPGCAGSAFNRIYFACNGANCSGAAVPLASQVQNPVALLPTDNNGVLVQLPDISSDGAPSVNGSLVLGIGTRQNNVPTGVTPLATDASGDFSTVFNGTTLTSFIDSGSNGFFFPAPATPPLPTCGGSASVWFCPPALTTLTTTNVAASGSPSTPVTFQIGNFTTLFNSGNQAFKDIGGPSPGAVFDWGLPFFYGRNVFVGIAGTSSSLGMGPYWAY